jgi:uncharacterized membrane protein YbhN (UPF0104 family)
MRDGADLATRSLGTSEINVRSPDTKRKWVDVLKIVLAVALVVALLLNTSVSQVREVFRGIAPGWLIASVLIFVLVSLTKGWQYYLLVQDKLSYASVLNVVLFQNVVTNLLAAGAGIVSSFALFTVEHGLKPSRVLGMFLLIKMGDLIQIWLFLLVSAWWVWDTVVVLQPIVILSLIAMTAGIGVFSAAILLRQRFLAVLRAVLSRLHLDRLAIVVRITNALEALAASDSEFLVGAMRRAVLGAFVYLLANLFYIYALARAFSLEIGLVPIVFVNAAQQLVSYLPIQVLGGLGVNDASAVYLFSLFGYATSELIAIMLGWRIFSYLVNAALFVYLLTIGAWIKRNSLEPQS